GVVCKRWCSRKRDPILECARRHHLEKWTIKIREVLTSFHSSTNLHRYRHFRGLTADLKLPINLDGRPVLKRSEKITALCANRKPIRDADAPAKRDVRTTVEAPQTTGPSGAYVL